jgi:hypothetical protein
MGTAASNHTAELHWQITKKVIQAQQFSMHQFQQSHPTIHQQAHILPSLQQLLSNYTNQNFERNACLLTKKICNLLFMEDLKIIWLISKYPIG